MNWLFGLASVSVVLALGTFGCTDRIEPAAFASAGPASAAGAEAAPLGGCDATGVAAGSGKVDEIGAELARAQSGFVEAMQANEDADHELERHLSRVALALTATQQSAFIAAYESTDDVKKVRQAYADKTLQLAAKLDEIDRSDDLAAYASATEMTLLFSAYDLLARSPCPARSVRFASVVLSLADGTPSRYASLADTNAKAYAVHYILTALPGALVERAIETETNPEAALAEIRGWLGKVNGPAGSLLAVIESKASVLEASRLGAKIVVFEQDALPVVRGIGGVLAVWSAGDDVAQGDVAGLLQSGPGGIKALLDGTNALRRALLLDELLWVGKAAVAVGKLSAGIGLVTQTLATLEGIGTMKDTDDVIRTLGNSLVLAGSIVALTGGSGAILVAAGTAAKILADILATPPEDKVRTLLGTLAANGVIPTESVEPLTTARNGSLRDLSERLGLPSEEVLWVVTRSPDAAKSGDGYRGLVQIGRTFSVNGDAMVAFLHGLVHPSDLVWQRWEMYIFNGSVNLSASFYATDAAMMRETLQVWADDFDAGDADAKELGKPRDEMTSRGRALFRYALGAIR